MLNLGKRQAKRKLLCIAYGNTGVRRLQIPLELKFEVLLILKYFAKCWILGINLTFTSVIKFRSRNMCKCIYYSMVGKDRSAKQEAVWRYNWLSASVSIGQISQYALVKVPRHALASTWIFLTLRKLNILKHGSCLTFCQGFLHHFTKQIG